MQEPVAAVQAESGEAVSEPEKGYFVLDLAGIKGLPAPEILPEKTQGVFFRRLEDGGIELGLTYTMTDGTVYKCSSMAWAPECVDALCEWWQKERAK